MKNAFRLLRQPQFVLCGATMLGAMSGCARFSNPNSAPPPKQTLSTQRPLSTQRFAKSPDAPTKDAATENERAQRAQTPVFIDVAFLAQRHPAWLLANALEGENAIARAASQRIFANTPRALTRSVVAPKAMRGVAIPALPALLAVNVSAATKNNSALSAWRGENAALSEYSNFPEYSAFPKVGVSSGETSFARDFAVLSGVMANRQSAALARFFSATRRFQVAGSERQRDELLATLEDDIDFEVERASRASMTAPKFLPSPETQLEMTNLRLLLLPEARTLPAQRAEAQTRLRFLENEWRAQLARLQNEWLEERRRNLRERPRQAKTLGTQRIEASLETQRAAEAARRAQSRQNQLQLLENDFADENIASESVGDAIRDVSEMFVFAENDENANVPQTRRGEVKRAIIPNIRRSSRVLAVGQAARGALTTTGATSSRISAPQNTKATPYSDSQKAQSLRAQAIRETLQWAKIAARRGGWRNIEYSANVSAARRDITGEIARVLRLP